MIEHLTIFGATGDLTARFLLPALAALYADGHLTDRFELTCAGRRDWTTRQFQSWVANQLDRHGGSLTSGARQAVVDLARYRRADVTDPDRVAAALTDDGPAAIYLALPPSLSPIAVAA